MVLFVSKGYLWHVAIQKGVQSIKDPVFILKYV